MQIKRINYATITLENKQDLDKFVQGMFASSRAKVNRDFLDLAQKLISDVLKKEIRKESSTSYTIYTNGYGQFKEVHLHWTDTRISCENLFNRANLKFPIVISNHP